MIDLNKEKENVLSAQERYDICSFAVEASDEGGFLNSFVFERAIYCYAAVILTEDENEKDNLREKISENIVSAWDYLVENDIIQEIHQNHKNDLEILAEEAWTWFDGYNTYITSARGVLSFAEEFIGGTAQDAATMLKDTIKETGAENIIDIADKWGMNRQLESSINEEPLFN